MLSWLALWTLSFVLMQLYVGKIAVDEAIFAAVGSIVTATASMVVLKSRIAPVRAGWRSVLQIWRLPGEIATDTWGAVSVLARHVFLGKPAESLVYAIPFEMGGDDDKSAFRRALAVACATASPMFVVVGLDREHSLLVYHLLRNGKVSRLTRSLGARP